MAVHSLARHYLNNLASIVVAVIVAVVAVMVVRPLNVADNVMIVACVTMVGCASANDSFDSSFANHFAFVAVHSLNSCCCCHCLASK